jgi:hypothetical protein
MGGAAVPSVFLWLVGVPDGGWLREAGLRAACDSSAHVHAGARCLYKCVFSFFVPNIMVWAARLWLVTLLC